MDAKAEAIQRLADAGQPYRIENGEIILQDTEDESEATEPAQNGSDDESDDESDSAPDVSI